MNSLLPSNLFHSMSFCNFVYDCPSWVVTKVEKKWLAGVRPGQTWLCWVPASLAACWKVAAGSGKLFPFLSSSLSLWFAHQHQKQRYRMSSKIKHKYSFLHIRPHTKACFLICSCFYSHKRGCNSCRNQAFWFYWLVTLFSKQYPDVSKQYLSILEQFHYSDN